MAFGIAASLDLLAGLPVPGGQDEASYVLAGDTFASGRLANPTHPLWEHFETFHVIHQPTYVSKFPPMQGFFLATGQVIGGQPAVGIWLGAAFMCAAVFWMLLAWLPPRWALFGGVIVLGQFGFLGYWAHSYWGGAVAAGGGALVMGSVRRIVSAPSARCGLILGLGLGILANTRPLEGLILALFGFAPIALALGRGDRSYRRAFLVRTLPPLSIALSLCAAGMGYYFWRTTGSPVRMPYQIYQETYSPYSLFQLSDPGPMPDYRHETMRDLYTSWEQRPSLFTQPFSFALGRVGKAAWLYIFYLGAFGILPLLALRRAWQDPWVRYAGVAVLSLLGLTLLTFAFPHYIAPATGLVVFIVVEATRRLPEIRWRSIEGSRLLRWTVALFAVGVAARVELHMRPVLPNGFEQQREEVRTELESLPGNHVVIVRYLDGHLIHNDWVFNRADIDAARVVWARDMGEAGNADLLSYFEDRTHWLLESGKPEGTTLGHKKEVVKLERYTATLSPTQAEEQGPPNS
jgi:hypothetical protein